MTLWCTSDSRVVIRIFDFQKLASLCCCWWTCLWRPLCFRVLIQEMSCGNTCCEKKGYSAALIPTKERVACNNTKTKRSSYSVIYMWYGTVVAVLSLSLCFNGHFPGGPGLAGTRMSPFWILLELRVMEVVVTTGAITHVKLQSKCHHRQTNTEFFYRLDAICCSTNSVKAQKACWCIIITATLDICD